MRARGVGWALERMALHCRMVSKLTLQRTIRHSCLVSRERGEWGGEGEGGSEREREGEGEGERERDFIMRPCP